MDARIESFKHNLSIMHVRHLAHLIFITRDVRAGTCWPHQGGKCNAFFAQIRNFKLTKTIHHEFAVAMAKTNRGKVNLQKYGENRKVHVKIMLFYLKWRAYLRCCITTGVFRDNNFKLLFREANLYSSGIQGTIIYCNNDTVS